MKNTVLRIIVLLMVGLLLTGIEGCTEGQSNPKENPESSLAPMYSAKESPILTSLSMLTDKTGWAIGQKSIVRTIDGGETWLDVTPPGEAQSNSMVGEFLDANIAWVAAINQDNPQITVFRTTDGGQTWKSVEVKKERGGLVFGVSLDFINKEKGWLMVVPEHGMSSSPGELFTTNDGGATWTMVAKTTTIGSPPADNGLPFGGNITFRNSTTGWVVGQFVTTTSREFYRTDDGGRTWRQQNLKLPSKLASTGKIDVTGLPVFFPPEGNEGILPVTYVPESSKSDEYASIVYITRDGGKSWQSTTPLPTGSPLEFIDIHSGWGWVPEPHEYGSTKPIQGTLYRTRDSGKTWTAIAPDPALKNFLEQRYNIVQLDFVTENTGWALLWASRDNKPNETDLPPVILLKTNDGGQTWAHLNSFLGENPGREVVQLNFTPEPVKVLEPGQAKEGWNEVKNITLTNIAGKEKIRLRLYMETAKTEQGQGEVRAIIEHQGRKYDLEVISSYGMESFEITPKDITEDGKEELIVTGGMGATYGEMKIIGYNPENKQWSKLLAMGTPEMTDLDGDGKEELLAVSAGSLPGYVWIYRWNKDHFEKADVAEDTGNIYAYLVEKEGKVLIESGKWAADKQASPRYYRYRDGLLYKIP